MVPVQQFVPDALAAILRRAPLSPEKVAFAWRAAVGPSLDKVTTVDLRGHALHVSVTDARWRREVARAAGLIRGRLDAFLGDGIVRSIEVSQMPPRPRT